MKECPGICCCEFPPNSERLNWWVTLIREDVWKQIHAKTLGTLQPVLLSVVTASGEKLKLLGETNVKVSIGGVTGYHLVLVALQLTQECR